MFTFDVTVYLLGKLFDELRVSASCALEACNFVEKSLKLCNQPCYEFVARRIVVKPIQATQ